MKTRHAIIEDILFNLRFLESGLRERQQDQSISFSFFKEAFNKTQEILCQFHDLELFHIEEMKQQMRKLVLFLSENDSSKDNTTSNSAAVTQVELQGDSSDVSQQIDKEADSDSQAEPDKPKHNAYSDGIDLPYYTNPRNNELRTEQPDVTYDVQPNIKPYLSLNDKFLFQRELFNNNHEEMSQMIKKLENQNSFEEIKDLLIQETSWDFDDETVIYFLETMRKRFA